MIKSQFLKSAIKSILPQEYLQRRAAKQWYELQKQKINSLEAAIEAIEQRWEISSTQVTDNPIFLLASGWRSGSTLIQRLVNSSGKVLMWGEPFAHSNLIQTQAESLRIFNSQYPPESSFLDSDHFQDNQAHLSQRWTANLYSQITDLVAAHRQFWRTLYGIPATNQGYARWGIKEVRLSIDHAIYLKWLFPKSQFIFLYRDPYKAYRSCRNWRNLYLRFPDEPVYTPEQFGWYWKNMMEGYLDGYQKVNGILIKYEDLCSGDFPLQNLASYLNLELDKNVIGKRIGSQNKVESIPPGELKKLEQAVAPLAEKLGYTPQ